MKSCQDISINKISIFLLSFLFFSCSTGLTVTFKNDNDNEFFKTVEAQIGKQRYQFKNLKSRETTKPVKVSGSYRFLPIKIVTEQDTLEIRNDNDSLPGEYFTKGRLEIRIGVSTGEPDGYRYLYVQSDTGKELKVYKNEEKLRLERRKLMTDTTANTR